MAARDYLYNTHTHTLDLNALYYLCGIARIDNVIITYARLDRRSSLLYDHSIIIIYYHIIHNIYMYDDDDASRPDNIIITCGIV